MCTLQILTILQYAILEKQKRECVCVCVFVCEAHPSERGSIRLQPLVLSVGQQPQSQQAQCYATEPSVPQSASHNGGGLGDVVHFSVMD